MSGEKKRPPEVIEPAAGQAAPKDRGGRPTKLSTEIADKIVQLVENGVRPAAAAAVAGVTPRTFFKWQRRGLESKSGVFFQLVQRIKLAEGKAETVMSTVVRLAAQGSKDKPGDFRAALAWLKARRPKHWNEQRVNIQAEVTGKGGRPLEVRHVGKTEEMPDDVGGEPVKDFHRTVERNDQAKALTGLVALLITKLPEKDRAEFKAALDSLK